MTLFKIQSRIRAKQPDQDPQPCLQIWHETKSSFNQEALETFKVFHINMESFQKLALYKKKCIHFIYGAGREHNELTTIAWI